MSKANYKKADIASIILFAQKGDIRAMEELIKKTQKEVYAIFAHLCDKKEDVSDLTQDALLKMAKSLHMLKDSTRFKPWLNQIVVNIYNDYLRKKPSENFDYDEEKIKLIKDKMGCEPGEKCLFAEFEKLVKVALMTLPKDLRLTIVLREYEGLSYEDIAKITNTAIGTVKSRISRARLRLQQELKDFI